MREEILRHLITIFGEPEAMLLDVGQVQVWLWPDSSSSDIAVLCTVGMSESAQRVPAGHACPSVEPRTELLCYAYRRDSDALAAVLADLSRYPSLRNTLLFWWQTVPLGRAIQAGSALNALFLSMPPLPADQVTFRADGKRVDLIWVVPISKSEEDVFQRQGADALEAALESSDTDVADLLRSAVA